MSRNTFSVQYATRSTPSAEKSVLSFRPDLDEKSQKRSAAVVASTRATNKCQAAYAAASFTTPDLQSTEVYKYRIKTILVSALKYHEELEKKSLTASGSARSAVAALRRSSRASTPRPESEAETSDNGIAASSKEGPDGKPLLLITRAFVKTVCKDLETMFAPGVVAEGPKRAYESSKAQLLRLNLYVSRLE